MGWCRALFVLSIVCATAHSKALTSNENVRKSRQLDFGECCPCPKPGAEVSEPLYPVQPVIDDCPCRNRAADSEGSSSMLSPALKALRPFIRSQDPKTELEPLLKPEVGLASSVLKTLQEVTNEEYEDALARDATRSVAKALESDLPLLRSEETPGSIINIILNPKETGNDLEVVPEASHLQETRCIHPLGSSHNNYEGSNFKPLLSFQESSKNLGPGGRNSNVRSNDFDMDNQASEIQNSLQKPSSGYVMKSIEPNESINSQESHIGNPILANTAHDNLFNGQSGTFKSNTKIPDLKLSTIVDNIKKSIQSNSILNNLTKKQIPTSDDGDNTSLYTVEKPQKFGSALKNLQNVFSNVEKPIPLKNLLKLKDVELVPKKETVSDQKTKLKSAEEDDTMMNESNIQTEILDAVPSSSIRVSNAVLKSQSTENNSCNDIINDVPSKESTDLKQQTRNNIKKPEQVQQEPLDEVNNPSTGINLLENGSDEQLSETPNNQKSSEILPDNDTSALKNEPTIKENQNIKENKEKNIFPTIKADIIKSFNNFKKVNDDMQKKLRQNLQEVLQVVGSDEKKIVETENLKPIKDNPKSITDDDLQKMSDSILNESNIKTKILEPSFKQAHEENELDNCVSIRGDQHLEENSFDENSNYKTDAQSNAGNLNTTPNEQHAFSNDMNERDFSVEQNNRKPVSKKPIVNSNMSGERTFDENSEDFADSVKVSKSASDSQFANTADMTSKDNNAMKEESNGRDLETEMSEINKETSNPAANGPYESISNNEKNCLNSNDMNVQASEPIGNRVTFAKPDFDILKAERPLFSKFPLGSGLKPYSARLASPHSLDRDTINPNLSGKMNSLQSSFKNNNLKNVFKNLETGALPSLGNKRNNILNSKPFHDFDSISDNFKSRADDTLHNLNNILGSGSSDLKSNHLYKNVLNNADDIRNSLSRVHYDLNDKLQKLHSDWTDKIHTIGQSADTPLSLNRAANPRKNIFDTEKRIPLLTLEKPRTETNIMKGKPKTLLNDEKFKLPYLLPKSLYKAPSLSERKSMILTTTKRPQPMFTTKTPPRKKVSLKSAPKPTLSQTLKEAIESAKSDKLNKMRDMKTLSSNTKPFPVRNQDYSARKSTPELRESLENQETVQPYKNVAEGSRRDNVSRYSGLPFQLKAEEFSVLKKLLDGIRSSQLQSDMFRNHDYDDNAYENLQAPSQNVESIRMPENTLKENVSYKCKMVCTKDDN
ncbi:GATA zinc finger domain-containing protein 14-like isoform X2 [Aricia agestis]|uniref:GATA zinc finger domain-containing protein 14-like isoform X2 n=1 Tax=Aricia agestis TaxID=91739 RepID=UPI001C20A668|nr:GATA zinc finger domain-containing protein 14-like isoform X2 [Aricia agestis]